MFNVINVIKFIQIDKSQITLSYLLYHTAVTAHLLVIIDWLLESACLCLKVIALNSLCLNFPLILKCDIFLVSCSYRTVYCPDQECHEMPKERQIISHLITQHFIRQVR